MILNFRSLSEGDENPSKRTRKIQDDSLQELALQVAIDAGQEVAMLDEVYSDSGDDVKNHEEPEGAPFLQQCEIATVRPNH